MKKYKVLTEEFTVSAVLVDEGVSFPNEKKSTTRHNQFEVTIETSKGEETFDFYGSHNDWENGETELKYIDNAVYCFLSDATLGDMSFEDFCSEFGYDEDSRKSENIHKACVDLLDKFNGLFESDVYDFINAFQEKYDC
jgi:hypothetical protein